MTETVDIGAMGADPRRLAVVGAGRAGSALAVAAVRAGWNVVQVASRNRAHASDLAAATGAAVAGSPVGATTGAALTLLTVPDSAITSVAAQIAAAGPALAGRTIAHCSAGLGSSSLAALRQTGAAVGVVHPLQALAGAASADLLRGSAFRIEGDAAALLVLGGFVADVGGVVLDIPPEARVLYHAAAVLAGNAPLALLERAVQLLVDAGADPGAARPALAALLEGAARNARRQDAAAALTGPVVRNDTATVRAHIEALAVDADTRSLYVHLARELLKLAGPDGREEMARVLSAADATPRPRIAGARVA